MFTLTFDIWPVKSQVSSVAKALFNFDDHCRKMFSLSGKKDMHFMEQCSPGHPLKVKQHRLSWVTTWLHSLFPNSPCHKQNTEFPQHIQCAATPLIIWTPDDGLEDSLWNGRHELLTDTAVKEAFPAFSHYKSKNNAMCNCKDQVNKSSRTQKKTQTISLQLHSTLNACLYQNLQR